MASVFRKLVSKELGESSYNRYFDCYQNLINSDEYDAKKLDNEEIYGDMYRQIKDKDVTELKKMLERLSDSMFLVLRISKTYKFTLMVYAAAVIVLLLIGVPFWIGFGSILLMTCCFLYKTYEYIVNKYCFIDAHIVIVYKSVLDRLILSKELRRLNK